MVQGEALLSHQRQPMYAGSRRRFPSTFAAVAPLLVCSEAVFSFAFGQPLELWTKYGRRGRIREPVGDHGTMKCIFDGPVQQRDSVCLALYKRAFPKWPQSLTFA